MEQLATWKKVVLGIVGFLTALVGGTQAPKLLGGGVSGRGNYSVRTVLNGVAATTTGSAFNVADFAHIGLTLATVSASGTVKFACSMQGDTPTFSSVQSPTNTWDYVDFTDNQNDTSIDGDTGVVLTGTTDVRQFEVTRTNFRWCTAILSPWTAGTTTVTLLNASNQ